MEYVKQETKKNVSLEEIIEPPVEKEEARPRTIFWRRELKKGEKVNGRI